MTEVQESYRMIHSMLTEVKIMKESEACWKERKLECVWEKMRKRD